MKIKDILTLALTYAGRQDVADKLKAGETVTGESAEVVKCALLCCNAVENELARYYFPLTHSDSLVSVTRKFMYTTFSERPVKILSVKDETGADVGYAEHSTYMVADESKVTVTYEYTPLARKVDGDSAYGGGVVDESLIAAGTASEFCLIQGEVGFAEMWERRYRERIDMARRKCAKPLKIPPRRWV